MRIEDDEAVRAFPLVLTAVGLLLLAAGAAYVWLIWPPKVDACLDSGGCWDECHARCEYGDNAPCHRAACD